MTTGTSSSPPAQIESTEEIYAFVRKHGKLRTDIHARRWTAATLQMLGVNMSRTTKKALANALPEELQENLKGVFWLAHFRDLNISKREFCNRVSRRSRANSDPDFAQYPVKAVFGALKKVIDPALSDLVRDDLAPELSKMWEEA